MPVSTRLLDADGTWLGMHDIQPGLGAIPTLKWVTRGDLVRDPHPSQNWRLSLASYPLLSMNGSA